MGKNLKNMYMLDSLKSKCGFTDRDFLRDFFSLNAKEITFLWEVATVYNIRPNKKYKTRSRVLFERLKEYYERLPF